jgi:hypothetical protein
MKEEIWLPVLITGLENYEISSHGNLRSLKTARILKCFISNGRYKCVRIKTLGRKTNYSIHRLVAEAFVPNPNNKPYVNHIDGNVLNNISTNLEWCTQRENLYHSRKISKNGSVISLQKIKILFENNKDISLDEFIDILLSNCN